MALETRMIFMAEEELKTLLRNLFMEINSKSSKIENEHNKEIYTLIEAGNFLRLSPSTLRKLVRRGKLKKLNIPVKGMRFSHIELTKFFNNYR